MTDTVNHNAVILRTTFKAVLLEWQDDEDVSKYCTIWVPRSVIEGGADLKENEDQSLTLKIKEWWWINHKDDVNRSSNA